MRNYSSVLKTLISATAIALALPTAPGFADSLCYDRHYDAGHLGKHPDQLVTSMTLALDPDEPVARGTPTMPYYFKIAMTKRGDKSLYVQEGFVLNMDGKYRGVVECDGGGFEAIETAFEDFI